MSEVVEVFGRRIEGLGLGQSVSAGSHLGLAPMDTPASIEVLPGDLIRARGDLSIVEAVTRAAGVTSEATPGDGSSALSARGFVGHSSVMQLQDGARLFVGAGTVTFPFDTWSVDRVEVLRGPASIMYGQGAIGGAVNVVSRQPNALTHEATTEVAFGEQRRQHAALDITGPINSALAYRLDASSNRADNWVDRGDSDSLALAGTLQWQASEDLRISLTQDYGEQNPLRYFGTPLVDGRLDARLREENYNVSDSVIHYRDWWSRLKAEWRLSPDVLVTSQAYWLKTDRQWRNVEEYYWDDNAGRIDRASYISILHHQRQLGNHTDAIFTTDWSGHKNTFAAGFDVNRVRFTHVNNSPFGGSSSVDLVSFDPGFFIDIAGTYPRYRTDTDQYSFFLENNFALNDQWSLVAGARFDSNKLERRDLVNGVAFDKAFSNVSWRAGVVFQPSHTLSLYGQYSTAVDPVGSLVTMSASLARFDLASGSQVEIGVKQSLWEERFEWTLAAYKIVKEDLLTRDPASANPYILQQIGQQSSRGLEASVALTPAQAWRIDANIAVMDARFDEFAQEDSGALISLNGNTPPSVPEQTANLWVTWAFAQQWRACAGVRYVGERYTDNANLLELPSYTVWDAGIDWAPLSKLSIGASLRNVTDEVYAVAAYTTSQWILGQPRTFEVRARYQF